MYNLTKIQTHKKPAFFYNAPPDCWVGPNTYDLEEIRDTNESYHPFLSSRPRFETKKPYCNTFYNLKDEKIKGGTFSKEPRFKLDSIQNEGPCDFEMNAPRSPSDISSMSSSLIIQNSNLPKLYTCLPKFTNGVSPPSVPSKIDQYGYDFDKNGNLIKNTSSMVDICSCKKTEESLQKQKCKPCNEWKKPTKDRIEEQYHVNDAPSPGVYDPVDASKLSTMKPNYAVQQRNKNCAPMIRYPNDLYRKAYRNNYPAPCDYGPKIKLKKRFQQLVPFGFSNTNRISDIVGATNLEAPAPNQYVISDRAACGYQHLKCDLTFGRDERFRKIIVVDDVPPPGTYTPKVTIQDDLLGEICRTRHLKGGFGTTSPLRPCEHSDDTPAPNQYCTQEPLDTCKYGKKIPTSQFISKTKRFVCSHLDTPTSFTYNPESAFKATQEKKTFKSKKRKKEAFLVGVPKRFQPFYGLASPFRDVNRNLGPGSYNADEYFKSSMTGYYLSVANRWLDPKECKPPPGSYEITKDGNTYTDSMFKAKHSFNIEVKNAISKGIKLNGKEKPTSKTNLSIKRNKQKKCLYSFVRPHMTASEIKCGVKR